MMSELCVDTVISTPPHPPYPSCSINLKHLPPLLKRTPSSFELYSQFWPQGHCQELALLFSAVSFADQNDDSPQWYVLEQLQ